MSLRSRRIAFKLLLSTAIVVMASIAWAQSEPQAIVGLQKPPKISFAAPLPPGPMAEKATTACTECHEARIILQQRLSKAAWAKEVDKMTKWGAVVDAGDRDALIDYLSTNFSPDKPPYEPPRSLALKKTSR
jgi:hypothetical protein